jgi:hypothetical protein
VKGSVPRWRAGGSPRRRSSPRADALRLSQYRQALAARFGSGEAGVAETIFERLPRAVLEAAARTVCRVPYLRRRLVFEGAFGMG